MIEKMLDQGTIGGEISVLTRVELIVILGKINTVLNSQVTETTLEQIFQKIIRKNVNQSEMELLARSVKFTTGGIGNELTFSANQIFLSE